jgi:competence protein ComEC
VLTEKGISHQHVSDSMFSRPLVLALGATITGILIGHNLLIGVRLPAMFLALVSLFLLGILLIVPYRVHPFLLIAIFLLFGVSSQITRPIQSCLSDVISNAERVIIEGTVYRPLMVRGSIGTFPVHAERLISSGEIKSVRVNVLVKVYGYHGGLAVGERIRFPARIREFENFNNPGGFDYRFFMRSRGLALMAVVSEGCYVVPMGEGELGLIEEMLEKIRGPLREFFRRELSHRTNAVYPALILGERQGLTSQIREPFDRSGVGHIMAVSGLHLGLVAWLFFTLFRWLFSFSYRLTLMVDIRRLSAIITTVPVIGYGLITGFQLSSQRAVVMILVFLWSMVIGRERDVWSSLSLAALIILTLNGDSLFTTSFQLSFVAVAGILWLTPMMFSKISRFRLHGEPSVRIRILRPVITYTIGMIAVTTAATAMTIPLIAYHFHRFSVLALPANLTVVPIIGLWVIPLGVLSSISLFFCSSLAGLLVSLGGFGLDLAVSIVQFWSGISWSSIWVIRPTWMEIILLYGLLFLGINFSRIRWSGLLLVIVMAACLIDTGYWVYQTRYNNSLRVTVLDVGGGSAALIQFPGKQRMLIAHNVFGHRGFHLPRIAIAPYLLHNKITRIDSLCTIDRNPPPGDRLQFMVDNFHVGEVCSTISEERLIAGARVRGGAAGGVTVTYGGWSFHFSTRAIYMERGHSQIEAGLPERLIITRAGKTRVPGMPVIDIAQTGALTVTVTQRGDVSVRSFLKTDPPYVEKRP